MIKTMEQVNEAFNKLESAIREKAKQAGMTRDEWILKRVDEYATLLYPENNDKHFEGDF
jgi:hypothetical protein